MRVLSMKEVDDWCVGLFLARSLGEATRILASLSQRHSDFGPLHLETVTAYSNSEVPSIALQLLVLMIMNQSSENGKFTIRSAESNGKPSPMSIPRLLSDALLSSAFSSSQSVCSGVQRLPLPAKWSMVCRFWNKRSILPRARCPRPV